MEIIPHVKQFLRPSNQTFIRFNALMGRFKHPVWVLGAGRSGTTWLCNMLCERRKYRFLFEPFHPAHNAEADFLAGHLYFRAAELYPRLKNLADKVFNGTTFFPSSDPSNKHKLFDGMLVKDISANLFAYALHKLKPNIDPILIIRNPFSVALSRQNKPDWAWFNDPESLLQQDSLRQDYLKPYEKLILEISKTEDFILKQILIWSIIHFVPLQQFNPQNLQIVFYEDLLQYTTRELHRLEGALKGSLSSPSTGVTDQVKYKPSSTTGLTENDLRKKSPSDWKKYITKEQLTHGNMILDLFGLNFLYDEHGYPTVAPERVITEMQKFPGKI